MEYVDRSFEQLYDEYYHKIFVYINCRVHNRPISEDLCADVFLKAFERPYRPELASFSTYVFTIAANVLKNYYRSQAHKNAHDSSTPPDENLPDESDILADIVKGEEYTALKAALATLPPRRYEVVYRRYFLDLSFKEIGQAMDMSEGSARKLHFDAIKNLRNIIEDV